MALKEPGQSAVAAADGTDHLGGSDLPLRDLVQFKLLTVTKVLEHLSIPIGDCDLHKKHLVFFEMMISLLYAEF